MSYGYDSSYRGMGAPSPSVSNYNTLYDSANEHSVVAPGNRAEASRASDSATRGPPYCWSAQTARKQCSLLCVIFMLAAARQDKACL